LSLSFCDPLVFPLFFNIFVNDDDVALLLLPLLPLAKAAVAIVASDPPFCDPPDICCATNVVVPSPCPCWISNKLALRFLFCVFCCRMKYFCACEATCVGVLVCTKCLDIPRQSPLPNEFKPIRNDLCSSSVQETPDDEKWCEKFSCWWVSVWKKIPLRREPLVQSVCLSVIVSHSLAGKSRNDTPKSQLFPARKNLKRATDTNRRGWRKK